MDVNEMNSRYGISKKKLIRMYNDGALKIGRSATPKYWQMTVSDIRKGKMSARSIALAYRSPEKLYALARLTPRDREILREHFKLAELPADSLNFGQRSCAIFGANENDIRFLNMFIEITNKMIPCRHVSYEFIAVRWLLSCPNDHNIDLYAANMRNALYFARQSADFEGWWHTEPCRYGKDRTIYHRPEARYDL